MKTQITKGAFYRKTAQHSSLTFIQFNVKVDVLFFGVVYKYVVLKVCARDIINSSSSAHFVFRVFSGRVYAFS